MDDSGYEVLGDRPPKRAKPVAAKPLPATPEPPADDEQAGVYGVAEEPRAKRPEPTPPRRRRSAELEDDEHDIPAEFRTRKRQSAGQMTATDKTASMVYGVFLLGVGVCMVVVFFLIGLLGSAPHKVFGLLGAGAALCFWNGLGLLLFPLPPETLRAFKGRDGIVELFQLSPEIWKVWLGLIFLVVLFAVFLVDQMVVPVEPGRR